MSGRARGERGVARPSWGAARWALFFVATRGGQASGTSSGGRQSVSSRFLVGIQIRMATTEREVPPLLDDQSTPVAKEKKRKNWVGPSWKPVTEPGLDSCPLIGVDAQAKAIGAGSEGAQSALAEAYSKDMTLEEAEALLLGTLKQVMEEKISTTEPCRSEMWKQCLSARSHRSKHIHNLDKSGAFAPALSLFKSSRDLVEARGPLAMLALPTSAY